MAILTWNAEAEEIASHKISCCREGRIYYFFKDRKAWHSSSSSTYPGNAAFTLTLDEAKQKIEPRREQGAKWGIEELPACIFSGSRYALIITEINTQTPLQDFINIEFEELTIRGIFNAFQQMRPNTTNRLVKFVCSVNNLNLSDSPLKRLKSYSRGGKKYPLGWNEDEYKPTCSTDYVKKIIANFGNACGQIK